MSDNTVSPRPAADAAVSARLLGRDYWVVLSTPAEGTTDDDVRAHVEAHVAWLLDLEHQGFVVASGPLLSGPGTGPSSGLTVLRAEDESTARKIAAGDPFVVKGLRTFVLHRWRLNEGSIHIRLSLGTGTYEWD